MIQIDIDLEINQLSMTLKKLKNDYDKIEQSRLIILNEILKIQGGLEILQNLKKGAKEKEL